MHRDDVQLRVEVNDSRTSLASQLKMAVTLSGPANIPLELPELGDRWGGFWIAETESPLPAARERQSSFANRMS